MVIRFLTKHIFPILLGNYVNRKMSDVHQGQQQKKREGEVNIDVKPDNKKRYSKDTGEYVDFEEIK